MIENPILLVSQFLILFISLAILVKSSDIVSDSASNIAEITGIGQLAIGFLMLSLITSLPELAIAFFSVRCGDTAISVGTLFGSNIANIGLVLGITAVVSTSAMVISQDSLKKLVLMMFAPTMIPILILLSPEAGRIVGVILLAIFALFCLYIVRSKITPNVPKEKITQRRGLAKDLGIIIASLVAIIISANYVVDSAINIATTFMIDKLVIGATIIAVGTSLPELSVTLAAARKRHMDLALGNILGSCFTNLTLILGFSLAASACPVNMTIFFELVIILSIINLALWRMLADSRISFLDGLVLIFLYLMFLGSTIEIQLFILTPENISYILAASAAISAQILGASVIVIAAIVLGFYLTKDLPIKNLIQKKLAIKLKY
ncbi:sodium:calcium antiporter [[Eubacterium] cellulosolvens]